VRENVTVSWDLSALKQLRGVDHVVWISTPATGRLRFDYYRTHWLPNNPSRHRIPQPADDLHPTIVIDELAPKDAGLYAIECMLSSSLYPWLDTSFKYDTDLVVASPKNTTFPASATTPRSSSGTPEFQLSVLTSISSAVGVLICVLCF